jgi:hypothetical protein
MRLTARGCELLSSVEQIYSELEQQWADVMGASHVQRMRGDVVHVLRQANRSELPPVPPPW